jgi:hypothetical protein
MAEKIDIHEGVAIGRLTVTGEIDRSTGIIRVRCTCECGASRFFRKSDLRSGRTKSCGCLQRELVAKRSRTHGQSSTKAGVSPEYKVWAGILNRCNNTKATSYPNYGQRGITVCNRWQAGDGRSSGFECFISDMGRRPSPRYTIEREDNDGNYEPGNCSWALREKQVRNRRISLRVVWQGKEMHLLEACELEGQRPGMVRYRLQSGWTLDRALTEPVKKSHRAKAYRHYP